MIGGNLGVDAISEFNVITTNASAQYGREAGGVINAITRSGTNAFHGSAYEFARNSALDARNFFDGPTIPDFSRNQFGGALGGPIKRDRTFFFVNYEGIRQTQGSSGVSFVPSQDTRTGILHNADGTTTTVAVDPSAAKYLPFWPIANAGFAPSSNGNVGIYKFSQPQVVQEDFAVARIDHRLGLNDSVAGNYLYDRTPYTYPDSLSDLFFLSQTSRQIATIEETHTFSPTIVNTFRVGLNRDVVVNNVAGQAINPAAKDPSLAAIPGQNAAQVGVAGLTGFSGGVGTSGVNYAWTSFQFGEDVFLNRGKHSIKAGFAYELMRLDIFNRNTLDGDFVFTSLTNFLTNRPYLFSAPQAGAVTPRDLQEDRFGGYVQDDWRVMPRLTLNIGLRYETTTVVRESKGRLSNLLNLSDPSPRLGNNFFSNPTHLNFEPRVGFAYSPFENEKTVVHGAFGIYDVLPLPYLFILPSTFAAPYTAYGIVLGSALPAGTFYANAAPYLSPYTKFGVHVEASPKRNYVMQWNLNVQRELAPDLTLLVGYVGNRGLHQPYYSNQYNIVLPTVTARGYQWPLPIGSGNLVNPNYGAIRGFDWRGDSYYDALQVGLHKNLSHGLQFQVSYTQSKAIDDTSSSLAPDAFSNSVSTLPFFAPARGRGPSDFNIDRALVVSGFGQLPQAHMRSPVANWFSQGWELGSIFSASDGVPFTPTYGSAGDPLGSGGLQDYPDRLGGPGCSSLINAGNPNNYIKTQCFAAPALGLLGNAGRNILTGPGLLELDSSVFKNVDIPAAGEQVRLQFRAEFFNVINHTNFSPPANTDVFDAPSTPTAAPPVSATAGVIASTNTPSRQIQLGLKAIF